MKVQKRKRQDDSFVCLEFRDTNKLSEGERLQKVVSRKKD